MRKEKRSLGVLIFGGINFFLFGITSFGTSFFAYLKASSDNPEALLELFQKYVPEQTLNVFQLKSIVGTQMIVALFFIVTGFGILQGKRWAEKATVYFAFFIVALLFIIAVLQPGSIGRVIPQVIYPGALILYFTNKREKAHYKVNEPTNKEQGEE